MILGVEFHDSEDVLEVYAEDASRWYRAKPRGVFFPKGTEEVQKIVMFCSSRGVPLTPRGGGTGLAGGAVPSEGGFVVSLEKMNRFQVLDDGLVICEAGAISGHVEKKLELIGYTLPIFPSSLKFSTIGGNIASNSAGLRSVKYGSTKDHIIELEVVLSNGESKIYRGDDARLFAGSEGTIGIITRASLQAVKRKKRNQYVILGRSLEELLEVYRISTGFFPSALEILDDIASYLVFSEPLFSLIVELEEDFPGIWAEFEEEIRNVSGKLKVLQVSDVWDRRKSLGPALSRMKPFKINEDVVIPISSLADYFDFIWDVREKIDCIVFGHLGVGIMHTNIMFGGGEEKTAFKVKEDIFNKVLSLGGSITGEHGTGVDKARFIGRELGDEYVDFISSLKRRFDQRDVLNPEKIPRGLRGCIDTRIAQPRAFQRRRGTYL